MGHIANMLREGGANIGGRLMQRIQNFGGGWDGELRAQQQAFDHFQHDHNSVHVDAQARAQIQAHHHHHRAHHHAHRHVPPRGNLEGWQMQLGVGGGLMHRAATAAGFAGMQNMMNYEMTGFDMGMGGNRPPTPKYSPPPEPEPGFTRAPAEDEVVVCPNCGDELAMGEDDVKQEIWVIKTCGHVSARRKLMPKCLDTNCSRHIAVNAHAIAADRSTRKGKAGLWFQTMDCRQPSSTA